MRCGLARCPVAKSTRFSITLVVSFSHVHAIPSKLQCNTAGLPSGHWVPTLPSQYPGYQRKQLCVDGLADHHLSRFTCLPKIVCAIQTHVHKTCNLHRKPPSIIESFRRWFLQFHKKLDVNSFLTFAVRHNPTEDKNTSYFKLHTHVLSKAIEVRILILWQVKTCSTAVWLSLPLPSRFLSFWVRVALCVGLRKLFPTLSHFLINNLTNAEYVICQ